MRQTRVAIVLRPRRTAVSPPESCAIRSGEATDLFTTFPATFEGQAIDNTAILIKHTSYGDANLDDTVYLADFNRLAASFGQTGGRWSQGNFNFDDIVNLADFNKLAANFGQAGISLPDGGWDPDEIA